MAKIKILQDPVQKNPLTIIFCLPGRSFSGDFLEAWSELLQKCLLNGIRPFLSRKYDPVVYYARNKCLGGSVLRGIGQKPFDGKVPYDYMMWIDSDIVFTFEQVMQLIKRDKQIVSGMYLMEGGKQFAMVKNWDMEFFRNNGCFQFLTPEDVSGQTDLIEVAYSGLGFMLVKNGVFESLEYPWFRPIMHNLGDNIVEFSSEDTSLCYMLREKGYKIYVDPMVKVGHEKVSIL